MKTKTTENAIVLLMIQTDTSRSKQHYLECSKLIQQELASKLSNAIDKSGPELEQIREGRWHLTRLISDLAYLLSEDAIEYRHAKKIFHDAWDIEPYAWDLCWYLTGLYSNGDRILDVKDDDELRPLILRLLHESPQVSKDIKAGKDKAAGSLIGAIMKGTSGKADPRIAKELIIEIAKAM